MLPFLGLPSYLSVHSGGIVNSETITCFRQLLPPKGFPTTQFSMLEAEDVDFKFDVLPARFI